MPGKNRKYELKKILELPDPEASLSAVCRMPPRKVVSPLLSFLYSMDEGFKWRAVCAVGRTVSRLAETEMESARVVMRRLMWSLNDESGGIGWGSPEAMGESMALCTPLADEYGRILVSYTRPGKNYLDHDILQAGVLWAIGRLARVYPAPILDAPEGIGPQLASQQPRVRGTAVWAAGALMNESTKPLLEQRTNDNAVFTLFRYGRLEKCVIGRLAEEMLGKTGTAD